MVKSQLEGLNWHFESTLRLLPSQHKLKRRKWEELQDWTGMEKDFAVLMGTTIMILRLYSMKMKTLQGRSSCVYKYLKRDHKDLRMDKVELIGLSKTCGVLCKLNVHILNLKILPSNQHHQYLIPNSSLQQVSAVLKWQRIWKWIWIITQILVISCGLNRINNGLTMMILVCTHKIELMAKLKNRSTCVSTPKSKCVQWNLFPS